MSEPPSLQYPIGKPALPQTLSADERSIAIDTLAALPEHLAAALEGLMEAQIDTPYRPDGWTIRQLVHHIADSHLTAYSWMRLALTARSASEEWPVVFDYDPDALAELPDSSLPAGISLQLLDSVHARWVATLRSVSDAAWSQCGYTHPETGRCSLEQALAMYAWHCRHHLAHVLNCRLRHRW